MAKGNGKHKGSNGKKISAGHLKKFQFKPGESGNPAGKPKGTPRPLTVIKNFTVKEFYSALKTVEEETKVNIFEHFIRRAMVEDIVLIALMKKVLPDMSHLRSEIEVYDGEKIQILPDIDANSALISRIRGFVSGSN